MTAARPGPKPAGRTERVVVMVTPEMKEAMQDAAYEWRLTLAEWTRRALVAALDDPA